MSKKKALVVLSGGQDSTTCLFWAIEHGYDVYAITFDYGQRHRREIDSACTVAHMAGLRPDQHEVIQVGSILNGTSPLVSNATLEQYADHNSLPGGLEKTFVPMRNQFFLTLAANRAFVLGCYVLVTGVCEEDYGGYPDCRLEFIRQLEYTCNLGTFTPEATGPGNQLVIKTPLMHMTKAQTVLASLELAGCYEALAYSHTSYDGKYPPTGHDHAALLREKGFIQAGIPDPLVLRAANEGLMSLPSTPNYSAELVEKYSAWIF